MAEQVCPHCDRVITSEDLAGYPLKLRKRELEKEFEGSDIRRRSDRVFYIFLALSLIGTLTPVLMVFLNLYNRKLFPDYAILIGVEIFFGIVMVIWTIYGLTIRLPFLKEKYVNSRLLNGAAQ